MYINAIYKDFSEVLVWTRESAHTRTCERHLPEFSFFMEDPNGKYKSIKDDKLSKLTFKSSREFYSAVKTAKEEGVSIYESDISPALKHISKNFYKKSEAPTYNVAYLDIEVDYDPIIGWSEPTDPYAPINAVTIYFSHTGKYLTLAVPPKDWDGVKEEEELDWSTIILFRTEKDLLRKLIECLQDSDVLSGWNSQEYDITYIYERLDRVLGKKYSRMLSFEEAPPPAYITKKNKYNIDVKSIQLFGRISMDYKELFMKFEQEMRQSYSLDAISEEFFPESKKLEHEESLRDLYNYNFCEFLRYNIHDTRIIKLLEDRLGYMALAGYMAHDAGGLMSDILGTIKVAEAAVCNFCIHALGKRVPNTKEPAFYTEKFTGALVLNPIRGVHKWVSAVDIISLYPSTMRSLNISPEKLVGQFTVNHVAFEHIMQKSDTQLTLVMESTNDVITKPASEWGDWFMENNCAISGYGTVFSQDGEGCIPAVLTSWFMERKQYKKQYEEFKEKSKDSNLSEAEKKDAALKSAYYYKLQYIKKIQLNALYGASGNKYFKFFDIRLAESTTRSGREFLMHMVRKVAELIDGEYAYPSPSAIYSDTDSSYFLTHQNNLKRASGLASYIQDRVNDSFPTFAETAFFCSKDRSSLIMCEKDVVADKSIFVKKKMYVMSLVEKEGTPCDELKIMGLQIKKTILPKETKKFLAACVKRFLKDEEWESIAKDIAKYKNELLETTDIIKIMRPTGIKDMSVYEHEFRSTDERTKVKMPGHIAAACIWNKMLDDHGDKESMRINPGSKMRWLYVTKPLYAHYKSIAMPTDLKKIPDWFRKEIGPIVDRKAQVESIVDKSLKSIVDAAGLYIPSDKTVIIDDCFEY